MAAIAAMLAAKRDAAMTTTTAAATRAPSAADYLTTNTRMPSSLPASRSSTWIVV